MTCAIRCNALSVNQSYEAISADISEFNSFSPVKMYLGDTVFILVISVVNAQDVSIHICISCEHTLKERHNNNNNKPKGNKDG